MQWIWIQKLPPVSSPPGNVAKLAGWIQEEDEKADHARPQLLFHVDNMEDYDIVFLGFPNWLAYHNLIQCTQA